MRLNEKYCSNCTTTYKNTTSFAILFFSWNFWFNFSEGYRLKYYFVNIEETKLERHFPPVLNISNEHTKFNHIPYSSICHKLRRRVIFYIYWCKNFWEKIIPLFLHSWVSGKLYFSWQSAIGRSTEPLKDSAIQYLEYGKQKRNQTKKPIWLPIFDL